MKTEDKFSFGKYKGKTLQEVLSDNCDYVWWCLQNIEYFTVEPEVEKVVEKHHEERERRKIIEREAYYDWLEEEVTDRFDYT